jgi:hypothetical protein
MPASSKTPSGGERDGTKKTMTTEERAELEKKIRAKVACEKAAYDVQWKLLDPVSEAALTAAAAVLQPHHYEDVVTERAIDGLCGFPLCSEVAPARGQGRKIHVSLSSHKAYDISGLHNFCGRACAARSKQYMESLQPTSLFLRTGDAAAAMAAVENVRAALAGDSSVGANEAGGAGKTEPTAPGTSAIEAAMEEASVRPPVPAESSESVAQVTTKPLVGGVVERAVQELPNLSFRPQSKDVLVEGHAVRLRDSKAYSDTNTS